MNAVELGIFASRIDAVCEEMGASLQRAALSPNIKDRLDFSCAVFDAAGALCAQAAHIPVHLGSMAYAMGAIVSRIDWQPGDMLIVNDPYLGGTHLPDVTLVAPLFVLEGCAERLIAFVVNRAHHADIGAASPGSMPLSTTLEEEGVVIPPTLLLRAGVIDETVFAGITAQSHNIIQSRGDYAAQISANHCGIRRLRALVAQQGLARFRSGLIALNDYAERLALECLRAIPDGVYAFHDCMDDDGMGQRDIPIQAQITVSQGRVHVDFSGTASQVAGNINCPLSVAAAAVYYVFRCLMPDQTPACAGSFRSISLYAPEGCLLNARRPAAVAAGNVETSTRVVDVVLGALAAALPEDIPAASQGSMNNVAMGGQTAAGPWDYYETVGGGMGAGPRGDGLSGVHTHMTNTRNTPVESAEMHFPLRIRRYAIRRASGGTGAHRGGDGLVREYEFLAPAQVTLLTERRSQAPWGLQGGVAGACGLNSLNGVVLPAKTAFEARPGDRLVVATPGGGGWGLEP